MLDKPRIYLSPNLFNKFNNTLEHQSMVHQRKYPLFYILPLPLGQGNKNVAN